MPRINKIRSQRCQRIVNVFFKEMQVAVIAANGISFDWKEKVVAKLSANDRHLV